MKKIFYITAFVLLGAATLIFSYVNIQNANNIVFRANVEALADEEETAPDGSTICYSESRVKEGYTYYDCQSCSKVYNEKGIGTYTKCFK